MALYRCAACGSPNVVEDTQKEGYSYVKGAIGTAVLGIGGAVAGINGKSKTVYKCPDCGLTLNYSMPFEIKTLIDIGVSAPASRKNLNLNGIPIDWKSFASKYRNIEKDTASIIDVPSESSAPIAECVAPALPTEEVELNKTVYKVAKANYISECMRWVEECKAIKTQRDTLATQLLEQKRTESLAEISATRDAQTTEHGQKKQQYTDEKGAAEAKLATLGLFQFAEKSDTKNRIAELTQLILQENDALNSANTAYERSVADLEARIEELRSKIQQQLLKQYPLPTKPQKPKAMLVFTQEGRKTSAQGLVAQYSIEEIFRFIEEKETATYAQIKAGCTCATGMTDSSISAWINALQQNKEICKIGQNYTITIAHHPDWASHPRVTQEDWRIYETYIQQEAEKQTQLKNERDAQFADIVNAIKGKGEMTIAEMISNISELNGYTVQTLGPRLHQMAEEGIVTKTVRMRRSYFECK